MNARAMAVAEVTALLREDGTLADFQAFHQRLDVLKGFDQDIFRNMTYLMCEVGEVARVLREAGRSMRLPGRSQAADALAEHRAALGAELADCLAHLFKIANYAGVDLRKAYLTKMHENVGRRW